MNELIKRQFQNTIFFPQMNSEISEVKFLIFNEKYFVRNNSLHTNSVLCSVDEEKTNENQTKIHRTITKVILTFLKQTQFLNSFSSFSSPNLCEKVSFLLLLFTFSALMECIGHLLQF